MAKKKNGFIPPEVKNGSTSRSGFIPPEVKKKEPTEEPSSDDYGTPVEPSQESGGEVPAFSQEEQRQKDLTSQIDANLERIDTAEQEPFSEGDEQNPPITTKAQLEGRMALHLTSLDQKTKALQKKREKIESLAESAETTIEGEKVRVEDFILPMPRKQGDQEFYTQRDVEQVEDYKQRIDNYNQFLKKFNIKNQEEYGKLIDDYNGDVEQLMTDSKTVERWYDSNKEVLEEELDSPMLSALHTGTLKTIAGIYRTPEFLWDLAAEGYNKMLDVQDKILPESMQTDGARVMTSDQISDVTGIDNIPAENLEKASERIDGILEKYRQPIFESIQNGNYEDAAYSTALSMAESLPFMASLFIPSAAGVSASKMFAGTTAVMGAQRKQELVEREDLTESQKNANALLYGMAESFEVLWGQGSTGRIVRDILKREGKEAAGGFTKRVVDNLTKEIPALAPLKEGMQESATSFVQNAADIYVNGEDKSLEEGVADAFIVGSAFGGGSATVTAVTKYNSNKKDKRTEAINMAALNDQIAQNIRKNIQARFDIGKISEEEYKVEMQKMDEELHASSQIPQEIQGESRTKALELQQEYDRVKRAKDNAGDAFKKPYQERLTEIEQQLTDLFLGSTKSETIEETEAGELKQFTNPTDEAYGYVNRGEGEGNVTLTKAEYEAEVAKREGGETELDLDALDESLARMEGDEEIDATLSKMEQIKDVNSLESLFDEIEANEKISQEDKNVLQDLILDKITKIEKNDTQAEIETETTTEEATAEGIEQAQEAAREQEPIFTNLTGVVTNADGSQEKVEVTQRNGVFSLNGEIVGQGEVTIVEQEGKDDTVVVELEDGRKVIVDEEVVGDFVDDHISELSDQIEVDDATLDSEIKEAAKEERAPLKTKRKSKKQLRQERAKERLSEQQESGAETTQDQSESVETAPAEETPIQKLQNAYNLTESESAEGIMVNDPNSEVQLAFSETDKPNTVKLESIRTQEGQRGQGKAKAELDKLTKFADENGITIELDVVPETEATTKEGLTKLYQEAGFVNQEEGGMVRTPSAPPQDLSTPVQETSTPPKTETREVKVPVKGKDVRYDVTFDADGKVQEIRTKKGKVIEPTTVRTSKRGKKSKVKNANYYKAYAAATEGVTDNQIKEDRGKKFQDALNSDVMGFDPYTLALMNIAEGLKLSRESVRKETGMKSENITWITGLNKESELPNIERAAEIIMENAPEGVEYDMQEVRNALIDIAASFNSIEEVRDEIIDQYEQTIDPYYGMDVDALIEAEKESMTDAQRALYESVEAEESLTDQELETFYQQEYEKSIENLSPEEQQQLYEGTDTDESVQQSVTKEATPEVDFDREVKTLKALPSNKMQIKADAINKKLDRAVKDGQITEAEADEIRNRVNSFAKDKFLKGLNDAIDDSGMMYSSLIPPPIIKLGLIAVREAYIGTKNLTKAIQAGIDKIRSEMGKDFTPEVENEFKQRVNGWLKSGQEKAKTPEGKKAIAFANLQNLVEAAKKGTPDFQKQIKDFLKGLPEGTLSSFKAKQLTAKAANVKTDKQLDKFIQYAEKLFNEAAMRDYKRSVSKAVKRAKSGKGKSNLGQYAKNFSGINLSQIDDIDLLERIEAMAKDLASNSPTSRIEDINAILKEIEDAKEAMPDKPIEERVKAHIDKRKNISSPTTYTNAEIERQELLAEVLSSPEDVDSELLKQLEDEIQVPDFDNEIESAALAARAAGNIKRAKNAIAKAFKNGSINEETRQRLEDEIETAVQTFNNQLEVLLANEKAKAKNSRKGIDNAMDSFDNAQQGLIESLLRTEPVNDVAWLSKFNEVAESIRAGNLPVKEITTLRLVSASKSQDAAELAQAFKKIKPRGRTKENWAKRLATKEVGQRTRNILQTQDQTINRILYSPMARALDRARTLANKLSKDYVKAAKGASLEKRAMVGLVGHYMREASLAGQNTMANGVEVGYRDIFGIILGNEAAMDAAGMEANEKAYYLEGQALANYGTKAKQKALKKAYDKLPKTNGYVDPATINESVLDKKSRGMFEALIKMFNDGRSLQEISNLSQNREFPAQAFYFPTWREGGDRDVKTPDAGQAAISTRAQSGKEKVTESLRAKIGSYIFDTNEIAAKYSDQTSVEFVYSQDMPIHNALLNSAIAQTNDNVVARAVKMDYNASMDNERTVGNMGWLVRRVFMADYADSLFSVGKQFAETLAAFAGNPFRTRSLRSITDIFTRKEWKALRAIEKEFGVEISSFQSADIERRGLAERRGKEPLINKAARKTMGFQEYATSIGLFMPVFRREFKNQTGQRFDADKFANDKQYVRDNLKAIESAVSMGQQMVYRAYGAKSKGASRRATEIAPSWMNPKGVPVTVQSDSNVGRLISHFGSFAYREQGEFFQSLKFFLKGIPKGQIQLSELSNATGILSNAMTYAYANTAYFLMQQILMGDDDEAEKATEEFKKMYTVEGATSTLINQTAYFSVGKYGKVSRNAAIGTLSAGYYYYKEKGDDKMAATIMSTLKKNFYVYQPINFENTFSLQLYGVKEFAPAMGNQINYVSGFAESGKKLLTKEEKDDILYLDFLFNATNLTLSWGYGTSLPESKTIDRWIRSERKKNK